MDKNKMVPVRKAEEDEINLYLNPHANHKMREWLWDKLEQLASDDAVLVKELAKFPIPGNAASVQTQCNYRTGCIEVSAEDAERLGIQPMEDAEHIPYSDRD